MTKLYEDLKDMEISEYRRGANKMIGRRKLLRLNERQTKTVPWGEFLHPLVKANF
eukprot:CAMPEP_0118680076 /NCGR_PEP_ID=MMETSP0800-20121206/4147_1 /TAXON_ID=210618 ORGANISM="Striatella unipunctata, Strain CCMP2910" /NCGR_SAMPLE_ID=MMETSP0800 /ASSEMBLY_ACC=CAM_ASM_000638 /LENGTH=54 /DNA_ID=CAMNT_0006576151 /DNA_START=447 /DNA_END=611 /DNA_ORIENTATION=+